MFIWKQNNSTLISSRVVTFMQLTCIMPLFCCWWSWKLEIICGTYASFSHIRWSNTILSSNHLFCPAAFVRASNAVIRTEAKNRNPKSQYCDGFDIVCECWVSRIVFAWCLRLWGEILIYQNGIFMIVCPLHSAAPYTNTHTRTHITNKYILHSETCSYSPDGFAVQCTLRTTTGPRTFTEKYRQQNTDCTDERYHTNANRFRDIYIYKYAGEISIYHHAKWIYATQHTHTTTRRTLYRFYDTAIICVPAFYDRLSVWLISVQTSRATWHERTRIKIAILNNVKWNSAMRLPLLGTHKPSTTLSRSAVVVYCAAVVLPSAVQRPRCWLNRRHTGHTADMYNVYIVCGHGVV